MDDPHRQPGRATTRVAPTFPAEQAPHVGATLVVALRNLLCKNRTRTLFAPLVFLAVHWKMGRALRLFNIRRTACALSFAGRLALS